MASELFVDKLYPGPGSTSIELSATSSISFKTNGITQLFINSNGAVTIPLQPAFRAERITTTPLYTTTDTTMIWNYTSGGTAFDNTNSYNTSTGIYTVPVSGIYFFHAAVYTEANTDNMFDIVVNSSIIQRAELRQTNGDDIGDNTIVHASCLAKVVEGDSVKVIHRSGASQLIADSGYISFDGAKIS